MVINTHAFKTRLEDERQRLAKELCQLSLLQAYGAGSRSEDGGYGTHMAEDASETFEMEQRLSLERNLRSLLSEVEKALHRLEMGTYGLCDRCRCPIEEERLEALPYASLCLFCCNERQGKRKPA